MLKYMVFEFAANGPAELQDRLNVGQNSFSDCVTLHSVIYLGQFAKSAKEMVETGGVAHYQVVWKAES